MWVCGAAGRARHEPDRLEPGLQPGAGEDRRAEQPLDEHAGGVVGEHRDRVRPHRRVLAVARDEPLVEPLDERVARVELVDADPTLELVEAHQVEHERGAHDPRRVPPELVERLAQQALRGEHPVAHVDERVGVRPAAGCRGCRRGCSGLWLTVSTAAMLMPRRRHSWRKNRKYSSPFGEISLSTATRSVALPLQPRRRRARRRRRSRRCRAGSSSRPAAARCRTS